MTNPLQPKPFALVVEDDPQLSQIFSMTLKTDFTVETILTGDAAIARLPQLTPSLVILDLNLPGASGKEVLQAIRADARLANTRVILTTADSRLADTLRQEADMVLLKPISPLQLRDLAKRLRPKS